jgi:4-hydroxythreonine-4-phosphate dehydrogenase
MGDPSGIGPEIALKAWAALRASGPAFVIVADMKLMAATAERLGLPAPRQCDELERATLIFPDALPVLPITLAAAATPGRPDPRNGEATRAAIEAAVRLATQGAASAVVTNPISKIVAYESGFRFPGHTEYLADLTADLPEPAPRGPVMMLACPGLRCALVSIHTPLAQAVASLTTARIVDVARVTHRALRRDFGVDRPRLALAGLNPHAGEDGALGREEIEIINPAAAMLRAEGIDISDAQPPDAMFRPDARPTYDAVICMYHDQGLIPVKALDFDGGVNVTLGLPIIRTSPDHGTGFDIAGTGTARPDSLLAALRMAADLAARRALHAI